jgi:hypothetical protein
MDNEKNAETVIKEISEVVDNTKDTNSLLQYLQTKIVVIQGTPLLREQILNQYLYDMQDVGLQITNVQWITEVVVCISYMRNIDG